MQKLRLVGLKSKQKRITDALAKSGRFEVIPTAELPFATKEDNAAAIDGFLAKKARCAFAVDSLNAVNIYARTANKKAKAQLFECEPNKVKTARFFSDPHELDDAAGKEDAIFAEIGEIEKLVSARTENRAKCAKLAAANKQIAPYLPVTDKFSSFRETRSALSVLAVGKITPGFLDEIKDFTEVVIYGEQKTPLLAGIAALKKDKEKLTGALSAHGLTVCPLTEDRTAAQIYAANEAELAELMTEDDRLVGELLAHNPSLSEIKCLHDYYYIEADKAEAAKNFGMTAKVFVAEGWVPKPDAERIVGEVETAGDTVVTLLDDVAETDDPPTLYKENKFLAPYQSLTDGYSTPSYFEIDPGPFTAFFFIIFFGMMTADMGYGLVLALGAFFMIKLMKPEKGMRNLVLLIGYSSISAIVWGILFGSLFGLSFGDIAGVFGGSAPAALWFSPMDDPIQLMILSLLFGVLHITCGFCLHFYKNIRARKWTDAFFDDGFQIVSYVGVFLLVLWLGNPVDGLFAIKSYPEAFSSLLMPGLLVLGVGLLLTVLTKGRKKPSVGGKIIFGLSGLYGIVNILSDVLSYARLFGITIASCAIAFAFNIIIEMVAGFPVIGIVIAIVLAIVLHLFNIAMGVLSAYVHNARLQYLEFYGKFYHGDGHAFKPLGGRTKYTRFA